MLKVLIVFSLISSSFASSDFIKVFGTSTVLASPDTTLVEFSMVTKDISSMKAQEENYKVVTKVIDGLKNKFSLKSKNIQTQNYSLRPKYNYPRDLAPVFSGMEVTNRIRINYKSVKETGKILDFLTKSGITNISNIQFSISNEKSFKEKALKDAYENAFKKAKVLAMKSGVTLGSVISIQEQSGHNPSPRMAMMTKSLKSSPVIEGGSVGVSAKVIVSFKIK